MFGGSVDLPGLGSGGEMGSLTFRENDKIKEAMFAWETMS